jgi:hypothetical protein
MHSGMYPTLRVGAHSDVQLRTPLGLQTGLQFLDVNLAFCYWQLG